MEKLKAAVDQIVSRAPAVRGLGEQATKQALILPMLDALGYDIWNPAEVCPEYDADFAVKKAGQKEKVDLAITIDGQPRIFLEVKPLDCCQLDGHQGQLARYFNAIPSVSLAVLTNGLEYQFFTDTGDPNVMDSTPFYTARLDSADPGLEVLIRFHKTLFSPNAIRDFATDLIYTAKMVSFLRSELDLRDREPSGDFIRWILNGQRMYDGRITANVVDRFAPIAKNALQIVLRDIVRRSLAAIDQAVTPAPVPAPADGSVPEFDAVTAPTAIIPEDVRSRIVTTDRELECFAVIKNIFETSSLVRGTIFEPSQRREVPIEIGYKDTTGYFVVYFNKPSWWCVRLVTEARQPWLGLNVSEAAAALLPTGFARLEQHPYADFRVAISEPNDILNLVPLITAAFQKTIDDRRIAGNGIASAVTA